MTITVYTLRVDATTAERIAALQASGGKPAAAPTRTRERAAGGHGWSELHQRDAEDLLRP